MIQRHAEYTKSALALEILDQWSKRAPQFVKVYPKDYRRMVEAIDRAEAEGLSGDEAVMVAFEENKNDMARVSGN